MYKHSKLHLLIKSNLFESKFNNIADKTSENCWSVAYAKSSTSYLVQFELFKSYSNDEHWRKIKEFKLI